MSNKQIRANKQTLSQQRIGKNVIETQHDPTYGLFQGLKRRAETSMGKDRMRQRASQEAQSVNDDERVKIRVQGNSSKSPLDRTRTDRVSDQNTPIPATTLSTPVGSVQRSHVNKDEPIHCRPRTSQLPDLQRPRGPRPGPADYKASTSDEHQQLVQSKRYNANITISQTPAHSFESCQPTKCSNTATRGLSSTTYPRHERSCAIYNNPKLSTKETVCDAGVTRQRRRIRTDKVFQGNQRERGFSCSQQYAEEIKIAEESSNVPTHEVDSTVSEKAGRDLTRAEPMLQRLKGLKVAWFRADQKLPKIAAVSDLGIWQRVIEMIVHVFTTLHHSSLALQVLRSKNARAGEYGKALRDFWRAIVYLLVLLSLLQLVVQGFRVVFNLLAVLAWPVKLMWIVSRWVCIG